MSPVTVRRRALAGAAFALLAATAASAIAHSPPPARLVHVDVHDRTTGAPLDVYAKDGRHYIVGAPGHEYAIRIRNLTGGRVLAVPSVDGVNAITGETASPDQSGYVIEPWGSVEVAGWRKSLAGTAAFFFTEHSRSYAARTGRPFDVGVIGVAAFAEKRRWIADPIAGPEAAPRAQAPAAAGSASEAMPAAPRAEMRDSLRERADAAAPETSGALRPQAKLGTGHGRYETAPAREVRFERASSTPAQIVAIHYDRYENLAAMGVLPVVPPIAHREPRPFPGLRFAPDPR